MFAVWRLHEPAGTGNDPPVGASAPLGAANGLVQIEKLPKLSSVAEKVPVIVTGLLNLPQFPPVIEIDTSGEVLSSRITCEVVLSTLCAAVVSASSSCTSHLSSPAVSQSASRPVMFCVKGTYVNQPPGPGLCNVNTVPVQS